MLEAGRGSCEGHQCDGCQTCVRGRCCRRDIPNYHLPELADWDGPIYGDLGRLTDDGDKAQCHCCGGYFGHLGGHVVRKHDLTPDEYKAIFGLNAKTGLIGRGLSAKRRANSDHLKDYPNEVLRELTQEQRAYTSSQPRRLQHKIDPGLVPIRTAAARKGLETKQARGYKPRLMMRRSQSELGRLGAARVRELMRDPQRKAEWVEKISRARGGRESVICSICGSVFVAPRWTHRKVCGEVCRRAAIGRGRSGENSPTKRPEVRAKMSAAARRRGREKAGA